MKFIVWFLIGFMSPSTVSGMFLLDWFTDTIPSNLFSAWMGPSSNVELLPRAPSAFILPEPALPKANIPLVQFKVSPAIKSSKKSSKSLSKTYSALSAILPPKFQHYKQIQSLNRPQWTSPGPPLSWKSRKRTLWLRRWFPRHQVSGMCLMWHPLRVQ